MSSLRGDVMLLTHGGGGLVVGAAVLLDGVLEGSLDVFEGRRVVAGPRAARPHRCWPSCGAACSAARPPRRTSGSCARRRSRRTGSPAS